MIEQRGADVRIRIRVQPRASRTEAVGPYGDALKVRLAAPPVDGAANEELVRWLSRRLRVSAARVRILSGDSSRSKVVEISDADAPTVQQLLLG
jgi:uncharacterized protein